MPNWRGWWENNWFSEPIDPLHITGNINTIYAFFTREHDYYTKMYEIKEIEMYKLYIVENIGIM